MRKTSLLLASAFLSSVLCIQSSAIAAPKLNTPTPEAALVENAVPSKLAQKNLLIAVAKANGGLVAVGQWGHILLSGDGGATWRQAKTVPTRLLLTALNVAGLVIAMQTGLASAQGFDPNQQSQSAMISTFMTLIGINLILATDLHYVLIAAMRDSYQMFAPGQLPPVAMFAEMAVTLVAKSFAIGLQASAPFIVFGLIFNIGLGMLARLMPQVQIFFIAAPAQIMLGFAVLGLTISSIMLWYLDYFETGMQNFLAAP